MSATAPASSTESPTESSAMAAQTGALRAGGETLDGVAVARLTYLVLAVELVLAVVALFVAARAPAHVHRLPGMLTVMLVAAALLPTVRAGDGAGAVRRLGVGAMLYFCIAGWFEGGLAQPSLGMMPIVIAFAGWLLGRHTMFRYFGVSVLVCTLLLAGTLTGLIAPAVPLPAVAEYALNMGLLIVALAATGFAAGANRRLRHQLAASQQMVARRAAEFSMLADHLPALVTRVDRQMRYVYVNQAYVDATGRSREATLGRHVTDIWPPHLLPQVREAVANPDAAGRATVLLHGAIEGRPDRIHELIIVEERDDDGKLSGYLGLLHDVTERERREQALRQAATTDSLTGLANRTRVDDRLDGALARARREHTHVALLAIDLDGFKPINDRHGHPAGDALLCHVAERLTASVRASDTVGRVGGDEFVVLAEGVHDATEARALGEKLLAAVKVPAQHEGHTLAVGASIGIALFPDHGANRSQLVEAADAAMYAAKRAGKNCIAVADAI